MFIFSVLINLINRTALGSGWFHGNRKNIHHGCRDRRHRLIPSWIIPAPPPLPVCPPPPSDQVSAWHNDSPADNSIGCIVKVGRSVCIIFATSPLSCSNVKKKNRTEKLYKKSLNTHCHCSWEKVVAVPCAIVAAVQCGVVRCGQVQLYMVWESFPYINRALLNAFCKEVKAHSHTRIRGSETWISLVRQKPIFVRLMQQKPIFVFWRMLDQ